MGSKRAQGCLNFLHLPTMAEKSWVQLRIDQFFEGQKSPTQAECDQIACSVSGASVVHAVDVPGSLSYTVVGTGRPDQAPDLVISFRQEHSIIDGATIALARSIHGSLVPEATYHGQMTGADPALHIYTMPYLRGVPCLNALSCEAELDPESEARHICYIKHLAR